MIHKKEINYADKFKTFISEKKDIKKSNENIIMSEHINGKTIALVREKNKFIIKEGEDVDTLDYIGGITEKGKGRHTFSKIFEAEKSYNLFLKTEKDNALLKEMEEEVALSLLERRETDIYQDEEQNEVPQGDGGLDFNIGQDQAPQGDEAPQGGEGEVPQQAPEQTPQGEEVPQGGEGEMSDAEIDAEIDGEGSDENVDHFVGKLTTALRDVDATELTDAKIKYVLNSVISALPLEMLSPDDRLKIARKIRKGNSSSEVDIPSEMMSEAKKIKEGGNTLEKCKSLLSCINDGQHSIAKETFNTLKNPEIFFNFLDSLDFTEDMINAYRGYFTQQTPEEDDLDVDTPEEDEVNETEVEDEVETKQDDDESFKAFIMKLATKKVNVRKSTSEPDVLIINGSTFKPVMGENGYVTIEVKIDDILKKELVLTNDCYENTYKVLLSKTQDV